MKFSIAKNRQLKDPLTRLKACPHLLEQIFAVLNHSGMSNAESVCLPWKRMIHDHYITVWKKKWDRNMALSSFWKTLAARMEYCNQELFDRIKRGELSIYRRACDYMDQKIKRIGKRRVMLQHFFIQPERMFCLFSFRVSERYLYLGLPHIILIINRWTRQLVNQLDIHNFTASDVQLSDRHIGVKLHQGDIVIFDIHTHEQLQMVNNNNESFPCFCDFRFWGDLLVYLVLSDSRNSFTINLRRFNPTTQLFSPEIERMTVLYFDFEVWSYEIYLDENRLFVDVYSEHEWGRIITVFDLGSLELIRQRTFSSSPRFGIKRECNSGVVIVETVSADNETCLGAWNVEKDTVQPISSPLVGATFNYSYTAAMNLNPNYQFVIRDNFYGKAKLEVFPSTEWRCQDDCPTINGISKYLAGVTLFNWHKIYFDGVQLIFTDSNWVHITDFV